MPLSSYSKIYALGHRALALLLDGEVVVQEKVDGSQFSFGRRGSGLICRSRNQVIDCDAPEKMFAPGVEYVQSVADRLIDGATYRCEYLKSPKHNTLAYDRIPENHLIVFDIDLADQDYQSPETVRDLAADIGLETVPTLLAGILANAEQFEALLECDSILGGQKIEGIVVKNYAHFDPGTSKTLMGKYVSERFKEVHGASWRARNPNKGDIIQAIGSSLCTETRWDKAIQHLRESGELTDSPKDIGALIQGVTVDVLEEEADAIKEQLFEWAWKAIRRHATAGLPEWYKARLAQRQFDGVERPGVASDQTPTTDDKTPPRSP